jgi:hypothetical protein
MAVSADETTGSNGSGLRIRTPRKLPFIGPTSPTAAIGRIVDVAVERSQCRDWPKSSRSRQSATVSSCPWRKHHDHCPVDQILVFTKKGSWMRVS